MDYARSMSILKLMVDLLTDRLMRFLLLGAVIVSAMEFALCPTFNILFSAQLEMLSLIIH